MINSLPYQILSGILTWILILQKEMNVTSDIY